MASPTPSSSPVFDRIDYAPRVETCYDVYGVLAGSDGHTNISGTHNNTGFRVAFRVGQGPVQNVTWDQVGYFDDVNVNAPVRRLDRYRLELGFWIQNTGASQKSVDLAFDASVGLVDDNVVNITELGIVWTDGRWQFSLFGRTCPHVVNVTTRWIGEASGRDAGRWQNGGVTGLVGPEVGIGLSWQNVVVAARAEKVLTLVIGVEESERLSDITCWLDPTVTPTATQSLTESVVETPTESRFASVTATPRASPTASPTASPSVSATASPTVSASVSRSPFATRTESAKETPTESPTESAWESVVESVLETALESGAETEFESPIATPTLSPRATVSRSPRMTPSLMLPATARAGARSTRKKLELGIGLAAAVLAVVILVGCWLFLRRGHIDPDQDFQTLAGQDTSRRRAASLVSEFDSCAHTQDNPLCQPSSFIPSATVLENPAEDYLDEEVDLGD